MPEQFENPKEIKVEDDTVCNPCAEKRTEIVADKAAAKPAKTEQKFDKENSNLFSK
jgi:hypothetical protein